MPGGEGRRELVMSPQGGHASSLAAVVSPKLPTAAGLVKGLAALLAPLGAAGLPGQAAVL